MRPENMKELCAFDCLLEVPQYYVSSLDLNSSTNQSTVYNASNRELAQRMHQGHFP